MGKLAVIKTKETDSSVDAFINTVADEKKREDAFSLLKVMQKATKEKPKMWGSSIIGFGNKRYKSPTTDREVDWFTVGFSPRKANLTIYLVQKPKEHAALLKKLGKHKVGGGCLYINRLSDIDVKILEKLVSASAKLK